MSTPQRIFYGSIESGTIWDSEQQAKDYHFQARYHDFPIIELVERTPVVVAMEDLLEVLENSLPYIMDALDKPEQLTFFNKKVAQKHCRIIHAALTKATGESA